LPRPAIFTSALRDLHSRLAPGRGVVVNLLFLNAKQWRFQFPPPPPPVAQHRRPLGGGTAAAGGPPAAGGGGVLVPGGASGVRYVSFKPGSSDAIDRVITIAAAVAPFPIILQWTGGRAGGHHSYEDAHAPLLSAYASARRVPSLVLVAGSGIGDGAGAAAWLS